MRTYRELAEPNAAKAACGAIEPTGSICVPPASRADECQAAIEHPWDARAIRQQANSNSREFKDNSP